MEIIVNLEEKQKLEAHFNGFTLCSDQPVSNNGENSAPSPFDYFMASLALCAGYFVKTYCNTRNISLEGIKVIQSNSIEPENKYKQNILIQIFVPSDLSEKDQLGILRSVKGCSVKKTIQQIPNFKVEII